MIEGLEARLMMNADAVFLPTHAPQTLEPVGLPLAGAVELVLATPAEVNLADGWKIEIPTEVIDAVFGQSAAEAEQLADLRQRMAAGDGSAIDEAIEFARDKSFGTSDVNKPGEDLFEKYFGEAFRAYQQTTIAVLRERLEAGDEAAVDEAVEFIRLISFGITDIDKPGEDLFEKHFGDSFRIYEQLEADAIYLRLLSGDETAIDDAIDHGEFFTFGTTDLDNPEESLVQQRFGELFQTSLTEDGAP